jgi:hypothetical protein
VVLCLGSRFVGDHLAVANDALIHNPLSRLLHELEHLTFFMLSQLCVELPSPLKLAFSELAVLGNHFLALVGAPHFVIELFLLVRLVLDELNDHRFALL